MASCPVMELCCACSVQENIDGRVPVWAIIQAFGGGAEHWYRAPNAAEVRAMTYLALIGGATGVMYFLEGMPASDRLWGECRQLSLEMLALTSAVTSDVSMTRVDVR